VIHGSAHFPPHLFQGATLFLEHSPSEFRGIEGFFGHHKPQLF
jgi:hypothetical protein